MLKKYIAIFSMTLAWVILFGHSIIPHDHHDAQDLAVHELLADEHHGSGDDHNDLAEAFAHFLHGADGIVFIDSKIAPEKVVKQSLSFIALFCISFSADPPAASSTLFVSPPDPVCQSALIRCAGLRAPPLCS